MTTSPVRKPLDRNDPVVVKGFLSRQVSRSLAKKILVCFHFAFRDARAEAMKDLPEDQKTTFYTILPRFINRYLRTLAGDGHAQVRVGLNGTKTGNFLFFRMGDLIGTLGKANGGPNGYSDTTYRRMVNTASVITFEDVGQPITPQEHDLPTLLQWDYDFKNGVPYGPDSVSLAAFAQDGKTLLTSVDLQAIALGKRTREASVAAAQVPSLFPGMLPDAVLQEPLKAKRRRGEPKVPPQVDPAVKTS